MFIWRHRTQIFLSLVFLTILVGAILGVRLDFYARKNEAIKLDHQAPPPPRVIFLVASPLSSELPKYKSKPEFQGDDVIPWFCRGFWQGVLKADLTSELTNEVLKNQLNEADRCKGSIDWIRAKDELHLRGRWLEVVDKQIGFLKACDYLRDVTKTSTVTLSEKQRCFVHFHFLRSSIHLATRPEEDVKNAVDLSALAHYLILGFSSVLSEPPNPKLLIAAAEKILSIDDRIFEAAKSILFGKIVQYLTEKSQVEVNWDLLQKDVERVKKINPNDPDLYRVAEFIKLQGGRPDLLKNRIEELLTEGSKQKTPLGERWELFEMLGYSEWALGNAGRARRMLEEALRLNPREIRLKETLSKISQPHATKEDYPLVWQFSGINFESLVGSLLTNLP